MNILLIDDEPLLGELTMSFLRKHTQDLEMKQVLSCSAGLEELHENGYDLVLMDEKMVGTRGLECLKIIRRTWISIPVVMLTGIDNDDFKMECMRAGADDYVMKDRIRDLLPHVITSAVARRMTSIVTHAETYRKMNDVNPDVNSLTHSVRQGVMERGEIEIRVNSLETSIRKFERIIMEGNGQPSLIQQFAEIKVDLRGIKEELSSLSNVISGEREETAEDRRARLNSWILVACAIIAAIAAVIAASVSRPHP